MEVLEMPVETVSMEVVKLNVTDTEIQKMKEDYLGLTVGGIEDKAGLKKVYESRQIVKRTRVALVRHADELKEKAIAWQRKVNSEKNRIVAELENIEAYLQGEEDKIAAEKERIRREEEEREAARIQERINKLAAYGFAIDFTTIKTIDDATFETVWENAKAEYAKEQERKAEEERLRLEQEARLKAEREELERLRAQQAEAQRIIEEQNARIRKEQEEKEAAIRAEQQRIENEKRELELQKQREEEARKRAEELECARAEAAEKARLKAIEDARREAEDKAEAERQAKIQEAEKLAQSSDKVKFKVVIDQLKGISIPEMKSAKAKKLSGGVQEMVNKIIGHIESSI